MLDASPALWGEAPRLTLSFAPDGTSIAGHSSALYTMFAGLSSASAWQAEILRGFQTWAVETNSDIGVVPDSGEPFGVAGATRRDPRFGDIRIGAVPMPPETLAISVPYDAAFSGTWVADVLFNSNADFSSLEDVFSVALHEAGHVLGLDHSADPLSPMHVHGVSTATEPTAEDIAALQGLFGARSHDLNELSAGDGGTSNDALTLATTLRFPEVENLRDGSAPAIVYGDLRDSSDVDFYSLRTPSTSTGPLTFRLRTTGISQLRPRLTLYDAGGTELDTVESLTANGPDLSLSVVMPATGTTYFARVDSTRNDVFGAGGYSLTVTLDESLQVSADKIEEIARGSYWFLGTEQLAEFFEGSSEDRPYFNDDEVDDDDDENEIHIELETAMGFAEDTRYEALGSISVSGERDVFRVESPDAETAEFPVLTVFVRSLDSGGLIPRVSVASSEGDVVATEVLANGNGTLVVEAVGVQPDEELFLTVEAADSAGLFSTGNYQLTAVFSGQATPLLPFASGMLTATVPGDERTLYVARPQLFHLLLSTDSSTENVAAAVWLRIIDENEQEVFRVAAQPGETRSAGSVLLLPGEYTVRAQALYLPGENPLGLNYSLRGIAVSDPLAIDPVDPTSNPFTCPEGEGPYCYPGGVVSENPYLWDQFLNGLTSVPDLELPDLVNLLLADWWFWYWNVDTDNGPSLTFNDSYSATQGDTLNVAGDFGLLSNDLDPESDPQFAMLVEGPSQGSVTLNLDGTFTYEPPDADFSGVVSFRYQLFDFSGQRSNVGRVTIFVQSSAGATVEGRWILYDNSRFDGAGAGADPLDDLALAPNKTALLPGATASFANYSSYSRGLNGIVIDVLGLADPAGLGPLDFQFHVGNQNDTAQWIPLPTAASVAVRTGAGTRGSDRITLIWPDLAINHQWLQVRVLANPRTGLVADDVFYFGNLPGETGNQPTNAVVDASDIEAVQANQRGPFDRADISDRYDFNRDGLVNAADIILARDHAVGLAAALTLLDAPLPAPPAVGSSSGSTTVAESAAPGSEPATPWNAGTAAAKMPESGRRQRSSSRSGRETVVEAAAPQAVRLPPHVTAREEPETAQLEHRTRRRSLKQFELDMLWADTDFTWTAPSRRRLK